jgi:two-component sensor histidine kinase
MRDLTLATTVMIDRSLLYVAEFQHRANNEYAKTISFVSQLAKRSPVPEVKEALLRITEHLYATSKVQRILRPPIPGEMIDFTTQVEALCDAFASCGLEQRGINLHLAVSGSAVVDAMRSWRASLIIAELLTNSVRHGCSKEGSGLRIAVGTNGVDIVCQISDNGGPSAIGKPGTGTHIVDALAEELKARISRSYTERGAVVTLCFPVNPEDH